MSETRTKADLIEQIKDLCFEVNQMTARERREKPWIPNEDDLYYYQCIGESNYDDGLEVNARCSYWNSQDPDDQQRLRENNVFLTIEEALIAAIGKLPKGGAK